MMDQEAMLMLEEGRKIFRSELAEKAEELSSVVLLLEEAAGRGPGSSLPQEPLEQAMRALHNIKGASAIYGYAAVSQLAHELEDLFRPVRDGRARLDRSMTAAVLKCIDLFSRWARDSSPPEVMNQIEIQGEIEEIRGLAAGLLSAPGGPGQPPAVRAGPVQGSRAPVAHDVTGPVPLEKGPPPQAPASHATPRPVSAPQVLTPAHQDLIRVPISRLDALLRQVGELETHRLLLDGILLKMKDARTAAAEWKDASSRLLGSLGDFKGQAGESEQTAILLGYLEENGKRIASLSKLIAETHVELLESSTSRAQIVSDLHQRVQALRLIPITAHRVKLERLVRDVAATLDKEVTLELDAVDVEIDKAIFDELLDPLVHLVRNAVDHGIEVPDERVRLGKPRSGRVTVTARTEGGRLIVDVADDGQGLDIERIRGRSLEAGLVTEERIASLTQDELTGFIFQPGFSTRREVTQVSGRGVGLDVVRRKLDQLRAQVSVSSEPGQGAVFRLSIPLSLATARVVLFEVAGQVLAIPVEFVVRTLAVPAEEILDMEGYRVIDVDGSPIGLVDLASLLGFDRARHTGSRKVCVMVVEAPGRIAALAVDRFLREEEIVLRELGPNLKTIRAFHGATMLGDGRVVLVLNIADLLRSRQVGVTEVSRMKAAAMQETEEDPATEPLPVLVVDDSFSTRVLEKNLLSAEGFVVEVARDGQEALDMIRTHSYGLIITDIEMPRLTGIQLIEALRKDPRTEHVPIVVVSNRGAEEERQVGLRAGANAYIYKKELSQEALIKTVRRFIRLPAPR